MYWGGFFPLSPFSLPTRPHNVINVLQFGELKTTESSFILDGESENATAYEVNTESVDGKNPFHFYFYTSKLYCYLLNNIWKSQILSQTLFAHFLSKEQAHTIVTKSIKVFLGYSLSSWKATLCTAEGVMFVFLALQVNGVGNQRKLMKVLKTKFACKDKRTVTARQSLSSSPSCARAIK